MPRPPPRSTWVMSCPASRSVCTSAPTRSNAAAMGARSNSWLPMCTATPRRFRPGSAARRPKISGALSMPTPNLFSFLPVEILAWVPASTSGLTRSVAGAVRPMARAVSARATPSGSCSILNWPMPSFRPCASSARVLPTPEKTMSFAGTPAASARAISPPLTTSAPYPSRESTLSTARLGFDLMAKAICLFGMAASPSRNTRACRSNVARE